MRIAFFFLVTTIVWAAPAWAQTIETRNTVSGVAGWGRTWDDEGSLGIGAGAGARIERRLFGNTRIELGLDLLTHDRDAGFFLANGRTIFFAASVVQRFGRRMVQPYALAGVLLARHSGEVGFSDGVLRPTSSAYAGIVLGAGLAIRVKQRLEIGPELRLISIAPESGSNPALATLVAARVGYRF